VPVASHKFLCVQAMYANLLLELFYLFLDRLLKQDHGIVREEMDRIGQGFYLPR